MTATAQDILYRVLRAPLPTSHKPNAVTLGAKLDAAAALYDLDCEISNDDVRIIAEIAQSAPEVGLQVRACVQLLAWDVDGDLPTARDPATFGEPTCAPEGRP